LIWLDVVMADSTNNSSQNLEQFATNLLKENGLSWDGLNQLDEKKEETEDTLEQRKFENKMVRLHFLPKQRRRFNLDNVLS
jgi:hypothetical protein